MASSLIEVESFDNLDSEIDYLNQILNEKDEVIIEAKNNFNVIKINTNKCLLLEVSVKDDLTHIIRITSFPAKNLKVGRQEVINNFLIKVRSELNLIAEENLGRFCLIKIYKKLKSIIEMETESNQMLEESFNILKSKFKSEYFKKEDQHLSKKHEKINKSKSKISNADDQSDEDDDDDKSKKKKKLKGADLIFQRFKWQMDLDKDQIIIGYLDRFIGIKEIKFTEFKGVHEDKEGVPFHRIRHFKINDKVVWDRENRIDLVTGADDLQIYFKSNKSSTIESANETAQNTNKNRHRLNKVRDGEIFEFYMNKWCSTVANEKTYNDSMNKLPDILGTFKLLTYNILSRNNFKKAVADLVKNESVDKTHIEHLVDVDRMGNINDLFSSENFDFILLQECEDLEEKKLKECQFIQKNYFILSANREDQHSHCVILSKQKPVVYKLISLSDSNKEALMAKYEIRNTSLRTTETVLIVNVHLTSGKFSNSLEKRKTQMETLKEYLIDKLHEQNLISDYILLCGDFNFDDNDKTSETESAFMKYLFLNNGFEDLCPNVKTFDPLVNLTAAVTSVKKYPRRLDRILLKVNKQNKLNLTESCLVNTSPFKLKSSTQVLYEPFMNISSIQTKNKIPLSEFIEKEADSLKEIEQNEIYLHPSDHYGISCTFKFQNNLDQSNLVHKSSLAILVPKHESQLIQQIREKYDPQYSRWPPHINIMYPFYEDINLNLNEEEEGPVIGDILNCLSKFEPFKCNLVEMKTFKNNGVVYLEPDKDACLKINRIFHELKRLFEDLKNKNWKNTINPHLTIAQPERENRNKDKNWSENTLNKIQNEFSPSESYASFEVDCIYWLTRTDQTPFKVEYAFPIGPVYSPTLTGLNPIELTSENNVISYLYCKKILLSNEINKLAKENHLKIINELANSIKTFSESKESKKNSLINLETTNYPNYDALLTVGSFQGGIISYDLDLCLVHVQNSENKVNENEDFKKNLAYEIANKTQIFHIVRNIPDAKVPIIELSIKNGHFYNSADLQIHILNDSKFSLNQTDKFGREKNLLFDNFDYMQNYSQFLEDEYNKVYPVTGIFENSNLKKFIKNYKDYQILISFVKHWAKCRNIYGKAFGFLGGISWTVMVVYFLSKKFNLFYHQLELNNNCERFSKLIKEFFNFYSSWNWNDAISLYDIRFVSKMTNRYHNNYSHKKPSISILQTVFPYHNTAKNVSKTCKNIIAEEIKRAAFLLNKKDNVDYDEINKMVDINSISLNRITFEIQCDSNEDLTHLFNLIKGKSQGLVTNFQRLVSLESRIYPNLFEKDLKGFYYFIIEFLSELNTYQREIIYENCLEFINDIKRLSYCFAYNISFKL